MNTLAQAKTQTHQFHIGTWWIWAACAAVAISVNSNLSFVAIFTLSAIVIGKFLSRDEKSWHTFRLMLRVALSILIARVLLQILLGVPVGSEVLFRLPEIELPDWFSGLRIGGIVTKESLIASLNDSLHLSGLIVIVAAAVSLTTTSRIVRQLPVAFHEFGMVVIIAFTFLPHLFEDIKRLRLATRWRGQSEGKLKTLAQNLISLSESALERSVRLAASLTIRGYSAATSNQNWRKAIYFGLGTFTLAIIHLLVAKPSAVDLVLFTSALLAIAYGIKDANKYATRTSFRVETWQPADLFVVGLSVFGLFATIAGMTNFVLASSILTTSFVIRQTSLGGDS